MTEKSSYSCLVLQYTYTYTCTYQWYALQYTCTYTYVYTCILFGSAHHHTDDADLFDTRVDRSNESIAIVGLSLVHMRACP